MWHFVTWSYTAKLKLESVLSETNALNNFSRNNKEQANVVYPKYMSLESQARKELSGFKPPTGPALHRRQGSAWFWEQLEDGK